MTTSDGYTHPEYLVDAAWVETHKDDPNLVIIDCDVEAGYNRGHIPGAALVPDNFQITPDKVRAHLMNSTLSHARSPRQGLGPADFVREGRAPGGRGEETFLVLHGTRERPLHVPE